MSVRNHRSRRLALIPVMVLCLLLLAASVSAQDNPGGVTLSLVLPSAPVVVGENIEVTVQVNTSGQAVDGAAAYLNFDPALVQVVQITPSTSLPVPLQQLIDNQTGTVDLAFGQIGSGLPTDTFALATVTLQPLGTTDDTALTFQSATPRQTDATFGGNSVFGGAQDLHFAILAGLLTTETLAAPTATLVDATPLPVTVVATEAAPLAYASMDDGAADWAAAGSWQLEAQDYLGRSGSGWRLPSSSDGTATLTWNHWIDLTAVSGAELSFLSMLTAANGVGVVQVTTDGTGWSSVALVSTSTALAPVTVDLSAFVGNSVQLRFFWGQVDGNGGASGLWLLDEVKVSPQAASVVQPTDTPVPLPSASDVPLPTDEATAIVEPTLEPPTQTDVPTVEPTLEQPTATEVVPTIVPTDVPPPTIAPTDVPPPTEAAPVEPPPANQPITAPTEEAAS